MGRGGKRGRGFLSVTGSISEREKFSRRLSGVSYSLSLSSFLSFKYSLNVNGKCTSEHIVGKKKTCNLYRFICESGKKINARIEIIFL